MAEVESSRASNSASNGYWSHHQPGFKFTDAEVGTPRFFAEVEAHRYALEPHIPEVVQFERWRGCDVLEAGCGIGTDGLQFARAGARYTGLDLTETAVDLARRRFELAGHEGRFVQGSITDLPFADESFDLVFSWGVIHHTTDMERALAELVRVCRPGGRLLLMLYHRRSLFFVVYRAFVRFLPLARRLGLHFEGARAGERDGFIARHFTRSEVERLLRAHGLKEIRVQPYGQDAELLPLPRRLRLPITERLPQAPKDWILRRLGHQLGISASKPAR